MVSIRRCIQRLQVLGAVVFLLAAGTWGGVCAQQPVQIPQPMSPPRMVNDYAHLFAGWEAQRLEDTLRAFDTLTSTQIAVVTVPDIGEYTPAEYATRILEEWGVGTREYDNGVVMLVKPRNRYGSGEVFIAVGYGLEGALPDILAGRIIGEEMRPYLGVREDGTESGTPNYYAAVVAGTRAIRAAVRGEYTPPVSVGSAGTGGTVDDEDEEESGGGIGRVVSGLLTVGVVVWIVVSLRRAYRKGGKDDDGDSEVSNRGGNSGGENLAEIVAAGRSARKNLGGSLSQGRFRWIRWFRRRSCRRIRRFWRWQNGRRGSRTALLIQFQWGRFSAIGH